MKKPYKVAELEYLYVVVVYVLEFVSIISLYSQTCYLLFKACTTGRGTSTRRGKVLWSKTRSRTDCEATKGQGEEGQDLCTKR